MASPHGTADDSTQPDQSGSQGPEGVPVSAYVLRLYVTGTTSRSIRAITNVRRICERHLKGNYKLEIVDLYDTPQAAKDHQIVAAPTLVRLRPLPLVKLIGDLSDHNGVLKALDLRAPGSKSRGSNQKGTPS